VAKGVAASALVMATLASISGALAAACLGGLLLGRTGGYGCRMSLYVVVDTKSGNCWSRDAAAAASAECTSAIITWAARIAASRVGVDRG
jgi:hypothetical protein